MPSSDEIQDIAAAQLAEATGHLNAHLGDVGSLGGVAESTAQELRAAGAAVEQAVRQSIERQRAFPNRGAELPAEQREAAWRQEGEQFGTTSRRALERFDKAIPAHVDALMKFLPPRGIGASEQALARQDLEAAATGEEGHLDARQLVEVGASSDAHAAALDSAWGRALLKRAGMDPGPAVYGVMLARAKAAGGDRAVAAKALEPLRERLFPANGAYGAAVHERARQMAKDAPAPRLREASSYDDRSS